MPVFTSQWIIIIIFRILDLNFKMKHCRMFSCIFCFEVKYIHLYKCISSFLNKECFYIFSQNSNPKDISCFYRSSKWFKWDNLSVQKILLYDFVGYIRKKFVFYNENCCYWFFYDGIHFEYFMYNKITHQLFLYPVLKL